MRVRIWISGDEGPSHAFELLGPPRIGERISIAIGGHTQEGMVMSVSWRLQGVARSEGDLSLEGEPAGSVTVVHVVCGSTAEIVALHPQAEAEVEMEQPLKAPALA
jgi:hypothetical protein